MFLCVQVHVPSLTVFANWPTRGTPLSYVTALDVSPQSHYLAIGNDKGKVLLYRYVCMKYLIILLDTLWTRKGTSWGKKTVMLQYKSTISCTFNQPIFRTFTITSIQSHTHKKKILDIVVHFLTLLATQYTHYCSAPLPSPYLKTFFVNYSCTHTVSQTSVTCKSVIPSLCMEHQMICWHHRINFQNQEQIRKKFNSCVQLIINSCKRWLLFTHNIILYIHRNYVGTLVCYHFSKNANTFLILVGLQYIGEPQHPMICVTPFPSRLVWQACLHLVLTKVQTQMYSEVQSSILLSLAHHFGCFGACSYECRLLIQLGVIGNKTLEMRPTKLST